MRRGLRLCAVAAALSAVGEARAAASLCDPGETVAFACQTRKGLVSLCQSGGSALRYRFGTRDHLELTYPAEAKAAADAFSADSLTYSGGGGAYVEFERGNYRYTVFTAIGRWGKGGRPLAVAGLAVAKQGEEVTNLPCVGANVSKLGSDLFSALGLKGRKDGSEFLIPEFFLPK